MNIKTGLLGKSALTLALFVAQAWCLASPAFADRAGIYRQAMKYEFTPSLIQIEGALSCTMGTNNDGQACDLKILENKTGKVFNLTNNNDAMRLFHSGKRNVKVEGQIDQANTLQVATISPL